MLLADQMAGSGGGVSPYGASSGWPDCRKAHVGGLASDWTSVAAVDGSVSSPNLAVRPLATPRPSPTGATRRSFPAKTDGPHQRQRRAHGPAARFFRRRRGRQFLQSAFGDACGSCQRACNFGHVAHGCSRIAKRLNHWYGATQIFSSRASRAVSALVQLTPGLTGDVQSSGSSPAEARPTPRPSTL
jgi:hypothetical protein